MKPALRDFQSEDFNAVLDAHLEYQCVMGRAATGLGKGVELAFLADYYSQFGRVLILVDVKKLVRQLAATIEWVTGIVPAIEMGEERAGGNAGLFAGAGDRIIVSTVQTQYSGNEGSERCRRFDPMEFSFVALDECELFLAPKARSVVDYYAKGNPALRVFGCTATPMRTDGVAMAELFEHCAFNRDIVWGIDNGYLVRGRQAFVRVSLDASTLKSKSDSEDGDYSDADVAAWMLENEGPLIELAKGILHVAEARRSIVVCPDVATCKAVTHYLDSERTGCARVVYGEMDDNAKDAAMDGHQRGEFQFLVSVMMLTKGYDDCLSSDTQILTPSGWKSNGEIAVGDPVYSLNLDTECAEAVPAQRVTSRPVRPGERMFVSASQHVDIRTTEGHQFFIKTRKSGLPSSGFVRLLGSELAARRTDMYLPLAAVDRSISGVNLSTDELKFVAWFMTDGGFEGHSVCISQSKEVYVKEIRELLRRIGFEFKERIRPNTRGYAGIAANPLHVFRIPKGSHSGTLRRRGWLPYSAYLSKSIATPLHQMSVQQFSLFWDELLKGDGSMMPGKSGWLWCSEKSQADAYTHMAVIRGFAASYTQVTTKAGRAVYRVSIRDRRYLHWRPADPNATKMWLVPPDSNEVVWCVQNRNRTLITRRNGKVAIVGNCNISCVINCRKTKSKRLYQQILGRGTRPLRGILDGLTSIADRLAAIASSQKPEMLMVNMVSVNESVRDITLLDILGTARDPEILERAKELQLELEIPGDEAIAEAESQIEQERDDAVRAAEQEQARLDAELEDEEDRRRRRMLSVGARVDVEYRDDLTAVGGEIEGAAVQKQFDPATEPQINYLVRLGVQRSTAAGYSKRQASAVISNLKAKRETAGAA